MRHNTVRRFLYGFTKKRNIARRKAVVSSEVCGSRLFLRGCQLHHEDSDSQIWNCSKINYCKSRIFRVHFIFVYFVRGGFRTKIKRILKIQSKTQVLQRKIHAYERSGVPRIRKFSAYEIFWIYSIHRESKLHWGHMLWDADPCGDGQCKMDAHACLEYWVQIWCVLTRVSESYQNTLRMWWIFHSPSSFPSSFHFKFNGFVSLAF